MTLFSVPAVFHGRWRAGGSVSRGVRRVVRPLPARAVAGRGIAASRGLTLVSKIVNAVANGVPFGQKEPFMVPLNDVVQAWAPAARDFFRLLATEEPVEKRDSALFAAPKMERCEVCGKLMGAELLAEHVPACRARQSPRVSRLLSPVARHSSE